nr:MAG TPA: hypothetical protein [Caudoviricetes sp.]
MEKKIPGRRAIRPVSRYRYIGTERFFFLML